MARSFRVVVRNTVVAGEKGNKEKRNKAKQGNHEGRKKEKKERKDETETWRRGGRRTEGRHSLLFSLQPPLHLRRERREKK